MSLALFWIKNYKLYDYQLLFEKEKMFPAILMQLILGESFYMIYSDCRGACTGTV